MGIRTGQFKRKGYVGSCFEKPGDPSGPRGWRRMVTWGPVGGAGAGLGREGIMTSGFRGVYKMFPLILNSCIQHFSNCSGEEQNFTFSCFSLEAARIAIKNNACKFVFGAG